MIYRDAAPRALFNGISAILYEYLLNGVKLIYSGDLNPVPPPLNF